MAPASGNMTLAVCMQPRPLNQDQIFVRGDPDRSDPRTGPLPDSPAVTET
jgi:hypothetical protein